MVCTGAYLLSCIEARRSDLLHHGVFVLEARGKLLANLLDAVPQWGQLHCQVIQNGDDGQSHAPLPEQHQGQNLHQHAHRYAH